ncbi:uncharacterized protein AMSG_07255 [Thecamonas trahens ATCC 50062]|uniref:Uncharacterized protein n=1 Tax=Thecamonas trahens ATCC 50062 TaxID=461836 RepID=A0A0L0DG10_THETB|nr:hypothetical protein AMSG_07255 [Thecamonas trahens ATCC 50062]KNC51254.1 hypothetical protein AMSG_07255 [Thecamonas trahens ATCC 50062]|eukprot:XP_013756185.1 hypothetical protein AMSG_07255 [Thecamonas trahens ATCC 50062]
MFEALVVLAAVATLALAGTTEMVWHEGFAMSGVSVYPIIAAEYNNGGKPGFLAVTPDRTVANLADGSKSSMATSTFTSINYPYVLAGRNGNNGFVFTNASFTNKYACELNAFVLPGSPGNMVPSWTYRCLPGSHGWATSSDDGGLVVANIFSEVGVSELLFFTPDSNQTSARISLSKELPQMGNIRRDLVAFNSVNDGVFVSDGSLYAIVSPTTGTIIQTGKPVSGSAAVSGVCSGGAFLVISDPSDGANTVMGYHDGSYTPVVSLPGTNVVAQLSDDCSTLAAFDNGGHKLDVYSLSGTTAVQAATVPMDGDITSVLVAPNGATVVVFSRSSAYSPRAVTAPFSTADIASLDPNPSVDFALPSHATIFSPPDAATTTTTSYISMVWFVYSSDSALVTFYETLS